METLVNYEDVIEKLRRFREFGEISGNVAVVRMRRFKDDEDDDSMHKHYPVQTDGVTILLVLTGGADIEVNMERYKVYDNSILFLPPRTLVNICGNAVADDIYLLHLSQAFLREVNLNYSALSMPMTVPFEKPTPVRQLVTGQVQILKHYFDLMYEVTLNQANYRLDLNIAASLVSALIYQLAQFHYKSLADKSPQSDSPGNRPSNYVSEFIRLLQLHYMSERSVSFYADKLFISPKYLSLLVKKTTGRSASRWIDDRVIMEARNLLRYSNKNIQQVAYMLNFSNQSSFGKYFKHLTGMSPTEYQKS